MYTGLNIQPCLMYLRSRKNYQWRYLMLTLILILGAKNISFTCFYALPTKLSNAAAICIWMISYHYFCTGNHILRMWKYRQMTQTLHIKHLSMSYPAREVFCITTIFVELWGTLLPRLKIQRSNSISAVC